MTESLLESECCALLHSVRLLEAEASRALHADVLAIDWDYLFSINFKAVETKLKYRKCRIKLARSKSPCDEEGIRQDRRHIQAIKRELEVWRSKLPADKTRSKAAVGETPHGVHAWVVD